MTRVLIFSLLGYLLITLLGPTLHFFNIEMTSMDIPLITMLYMVLSGRGVGLARSYYRSSLISVGIDWSGGCTGLLLGYVSDVMGAGVKGVHCLTMAMIFLLSLWASRHVYLAGKLSVIVVTFAASALATSIHLIIRWVLLDVAVSLATLTVIFSQAMLTAVAAPFLMRAFRGIDRRLMKDHVERGTLCQ